MNVAAQNGHADRVLRSELLQANDKLATFVFMMAGCVMIVEVVKQID